MQKIWHSESNQTLYVFDEANVVKQINKKLKSATNKANRIENYIIGLNVFVTVVLFTIAILNDNLGNWEYLMAIFALITIGFVLFYRKKRHEFTAEPGDKVLADLNQTIHHTTIITKITNLFLIWYILGVAILTISNMCLQEISFWFITPIAVTMLIGYIVGRWEQKNIHEKRRDQLIDLKTKMLEEVKE